MPQAQILNRQVSFIAEATFGTTPATPQTQVLDVVDVSFDLNPEEVQSRTLASHGQLVESGRGNTFAEGNVVFELNPTNADDWLQAGLMGTWATNTLKVGKTFRHFSIEEGYTDVSQFRVMTGATVNSIGMTLASNEYAAITCGLVGKSVSQWTGTSLDTTPTAAATGSRFFHDGGVFQIGGVAVGSLDTMTWTWENGLSPFFGLGSSAVQYFNVAPIRTLKGSVGGAFETVAELNKFITNTTSSIQSQLTAGSDSLTVKIGSVKYSNVTYSNDNGGVTWSADFTGIYNAADASTLVITRV